MQSYCVAPAILQLVKPRPSYPPFWNEKERNAARPMVQAADMCNDRFFLLFNKQHIDQQKPIVGLWHFIDATLPKNFLLTIGPFHFVTSVSIEKMSMSYRRMKLIRRRVRPDNEFCREHGLREGRILLLCWVGDGKRRKRNRPGGRRALVPVSPNRQPKWIDYNERISLRTSCSIDSNHRGERTHR